MKPVRLVLSALGPFVGPLELDFRLLGENRLFLLNGPTGSGKTMLLDAMCFALFGETTGKVRSPKSIRSQHAPVGLRTEVTFDFAVGAERYRVHRQPEQERPRQRGGGATTEALKATLWRRTGIEDDADAGVALAARPGEVTEEVQRILGFTADQFRHVTVLPQGEFQRFLQAKSEERESILEVLFQTSAWREVQEALSAREQKARAAVQQQHEARGILLSQADVESEQALEARIQNVEQALLAAAERLAALRLARQTAQDAHDAGREAARKLGELCQAEAACDLLTAQSADFARKGEELAVARRAASLAPIEADWRERHREAGEAATALVEAGADLQAAEAAARKTQQDSSAEEAREPERAEAVRREQQLRDLAAKVELLSRAREDAAKAEALLLDRETLLAAVREQWQRREEAVARAEAERETLEPVAARLEPLRAESAEFERVAAKRGRLAAVDTQYRQAARDAEQAAQHLAAAQAACEAARVAVEKSDALWVEAQAALLAQHLAPGQPCPVCGSPEHPAPAVSVAPLPSERDRKRKREDLSRAEAERDVRLAAERQAGIAVAALEAEKQSVETDLAAWAAVAPAPFAAQVAANRQALAEAERAASRLAAIKLQLEEARQAQLQDAPRREQAETAVHDAALKAEGCRALERERSEGVPEELREPVKLAAAVREAGERVRQLREALERARNAANAAAQKLSASQASHQAAATLAAGTREAAGAARGRFDTALSEAGFATEEPYRAALRTPDQRAALDRAIEQFHGNLKAAESRLLRAREQAEGVAEPDLAALEARLLLARAALENGILEQAHLERDLDQSRRWLSDLETLARESAEAERKQRVIGTLAQTASGANSRRITLQRFVQVTLLEQVLAAATARLQVMSSGRYWLRVATDTLDRRLAGGLDLEVFDVHTGQPRRVSTLSGGESFLASLALALGLSDVVQSRSGDCHLESIFVDEGFGTLDPEALELALDALRNLQQGGRLVGIISHVPELRRQIDVRLDVVPLKRGSTARFVIAGRGSSGEPLPVAE